MLNVLQCTGRPFSRQQRIFQPQMSIVQRLRNPELEQRFFPCCLVNSYRAHCFLYSKTSIVPFILQIKKIFYLYISDSNCEIYLRALKVATSIYFSLKIYLFYLFIFGCIGSQLLRTGFSLVAASGSALRCGARASDCCGFSCCGARALGTRASVVVARGLQGTGSVVVAHGLSCSTACGTFPDQGSNHVPCIGRRILNHCATREALLFTFVLKSFIYRDWIEMAGRVSTCSTLFLPLQNLRNNKKKLFL